MSPAHESNGLEKIMSRAADHPADSNHAAWLPSPGAQLEVLAAHFPYNVKPDHVIIKTHAVAINPVDYVMQDHGTFDPHYPTILGWDLAGTVFDVGRNVKGRFKEGDRVLGGAIPIDDKPAQEGAFQEYVSCHADLVAKIPEDVTFVEASTLPLALNTAACGLYGKGFLELPYPSLQPAETGKSILIWGGASSVGCAAIQLAAASGLHVIATASEKHHDLCRSLGAHAVFDYRATIVEKQILNLVTKDTLIGVFDAIGSAESCKPVYSILSQLGGGQVANVRSAPEEPPASIKVNMIMAWTILKENPEVARKLFGEFLPEALEKEVFKPAPPALVVGKGLEKVQEGLDLGRKGVSGRKVVIKI